MERDLTPLDTGDTLGSPNIEASLALIMTRRVPVLKIHPLMARVRFVCS